MPACVRTWLRVIDEVSEATSTSRMREFAAERLSRIVWMLLVATLRRFIAAPNLERAVEVLPIAVSIVDSDARAAEAVVPLIFVVDAGRAVNATPPKVTLT